YVAHDALAQGLLRPLLERWTLPAQEMHAVYPSPRHVPAKVTALVNWLQGQFEGEWWRELSLPRPQVSPASP
ncbi:MAG: hypothetical protein ACOVOG_13075, partial [Rubrivivax sp.]